MSKINSRSSSTRYGHERNRFESKERKLRSSAVRIKNPNLIEELLDEEHSDDVIDGDQNSPDSNDN